MNKAYYLPFISAVLTLIPSCDYKVYYTGHGVIMRVFFPFIDKDEIIPMIKHLRYLLPDDFILDWDFADSPVYEDNDDIPF